MTELEMCTDACLLDLTENTGDELINESASAILESITAVCGMISNDAKLPSTQNRAEVIHTLSDSVNLLTQSISRFGYDEGDEK